MRATRVELRSVTAAYSSTPVLHDVSVAAEPGELLALLGPSGCGKTTILRVIAGLLLPSGGEVLFDDAVVTRIPTEQRGATMVFQKPLLFPHLSVEGNIGFGLRMRGVAQDEMRRRVHEALSLVRLEGFERRRATQLSGGQEQRVALARAMVTEPRVLLLDEPFAALDEELRAEMRDLVRELQQRLGITVVFVTHDQAEAARVSDRVALVLDGRVEQTGTAGELVRNPVSAAAARFFGWRMWKPDVYYRPEDARVETAGEDLGFVKALLDTGTHFALTIELDRGITVEARQTTCTTAKGDRVAVTIPPERLRAF